MKTKHLFLRCAAVLASVMLLAGCGDDTTKPKDPTPPDYNNLKFSITVADKPGVASQTAGWANGDRIIVFFGTSANRALLTYNGSGWDASEVSISSLSAMSKAQALYADNFSASGGDIGGISGDLLFDDNGRYTFETATNTVTLGLNLQRELTSVVRMASADGLEENRKWRLAGSGILVQTKSALAANLFSSEFTFANVLETNLFEASVATAGKAAVPDNALTTASEAVFHIVDKSPTGTDLAMYNIDSPTDIFTRFYEDDLGRVSSLSGPSSDEAEEWWNVNSPPTLVSATSIGGVTAPRATSSKATTVNNGPGFTATLTWEGGADGEAAFGFNKVYTARIVLSATSRYTFDGGYASTDDIAGFTVNGIAPTWVGNSGTQLTFTVAFPATDRSMDEGTRIDGVYYKSVAAESTDIGVSNAGYSGWETGSYSGSVTIPGTVTYYGVTYNVTEISVGTIVWCADLQEVIIQEGVRKIGGYSFEGSALQRLVLPASMEEIAGGAFWQCSNMMIELAPGSTNFSLDAAGGLYKGSTLAWFPEKLTGDYALRDGTTTMGWGATQDCRFTSLNIPASVNDIDGSNLRNCGSLTTLILNWAEPGDVALDSPFPGTDKSKITLKVPAAAIDKYRAHSFWGSGFKEIVAQ